MKRSLYILGQLSDSDAEWLFRVGAKQTLQVGDILIQEGQAPQAFYIVLDGLLVVTSGNNELSTLSVGDVVGEVSFVDASAAAATVKARTEATLLAIPRSHLQDKLEEDAEFGRNFYKALAISVAYRLRTSLNALNQASGGPITDENALDANVMDTLFMAGLRMERLIKQALG